MTTAAPTDLIRVGQIEIKFIATAAETRGAVSMFEVAVPPGSRVPPEHFHDVEEVVYGLEGVLTFWTNNQPHEIRPGESLFVGANVEHRFENRHDAVARVLTVQTPGSIGPDFYREMGAMIDAGGPPDPVKMKETMLKHGLTPIPPRS